MLYRREQVEPVYARTSPATHSVAALAALVLGLGLVDSVGRSDLVALTEVPKPSLHPTLPI